MIVSIGIFEVIKNAIQPMNSQISCFFKKKNLSPAMLLASVSEEIEINKKPMIIRIEVKSIKGDNFCFFSTDFFDDLVIYGDIIRRINNSIFDF